MIHLCHSPKYRTKNVFTLFLFLENNCKIQDTWTKTDLALYATGFLYCHVYVACVFSNGPRVVT